MYDQKETFEFDVIIIGAGIVGLAIAHGLMDQYENILIVEKDTIETMEDIGNLQVNAAFDRPQKLKRMSDLVDQYVISFYASN